MAFAKGPQVGDIVAGKYRVERELGHGGMGYVVAARHVDLDELVAIKLVHDALLSNDRVVDRFLREARNAVRIKSDHVARVIDVGRTEAGVPFMVMEYLEGSDLAEVMDHGAATPPARPAIVVDWLLQAMEAIAEAHSLGIIHRDLKPANLYVSRTAGGALSIKVLDFGVAKALLPEDSQDVSVTQTSEVVGSPLYMAPEQMSGSKNVDGRADVWSLGIILYRLLSGQLPFSGDTLPEVCAKVYSKDPLPLRSLVPHLPRGLDEIVHGCLVKQRSARIGSVCDLARMLAPYGPPAAARRLERILAFDPGPRNTSLVDATVSGHALTAISVPAPSPARGLILAIGVVFSLLFLTGAGLITLHLKRAQPAAASAPPPAAPEPPPVVTVVATPPTAAPPAAPAEKAPTPSVSVSDGPSAAPGMAKKTPSRRPNPTARTPAPAPVPQKKDFEDPK